MTHDLAAALLKDVPRHTAQDAASMTTHGASIWVHEDAVLAALRAGLDDAVIKRAAWELEAKMQKARADTAEAKVEKLRKALRGMPSVVRHTTVCQGPSWPDDRPGVWIAALTACENAVQGAVDAALTTEADNG